ncbi:hypothetical protein GCM10010171_12420 [Actinokineospora fastidiosa]|uniref:Uncharacterized protein n=1 Tax=Actinokineospora fastidiosa TaxID=1816 RepID=A0A918G6K6_9PSEU|nr:hypothetical protein GCM10010171_12420 [Actinokineospora fastidiosa]
MTFEMSAAGEELTGQARAESGLPGSASPKPLGEAWVMVSDELDERWQNAYKAYGAASENVARLGPSAPGAAARMVSASWDVAAIWREMAAAGGLPWWALAAVHAAAEAFEAQSREWAARSSAEHDRQSGRGRRPRTQRDSR